MPVDSGKGVYDDPWVDDDAEEVDKVELLLPTQDTLGFVDGPPLGTQQFGTDVVPIDKNIGEGNQDNQRQHYTVYREANDGDDIVRIGVLVLGFL